MASEITLDEGIISVGGQAIGRINTQISRLSAVREFEEWFDNKSMKPKEVGATLLEAIPGKLDHSTGLFTMDEIIEAIEQAIRDL